MSKIINRPVAVTTDHTGYPVRFHWQGRWRDVEVLEEWRDTGAW